MDKETDRMTLFKEITARLQQAALRYNGMCASAALEVLSGLFGTPVNEAVLASGLGIRFSDSSGAGLSVYAGTMMYIAHQANLNGLTQDDILELCVQWQQLVREQPDAPYNEQDVPEHVATILVKAFHFIDGHREMLGMVREVAKPKQYYDNIYTDRESMFRHSPYTLEEKLSKAVTRGDEATALAVLREINAHGEKAVLSKDPLRSVKNSLIGSIAFLSRAAIQAGVNANEAFALSDALTQRVEEMNSRARVLAFEESILLQFIALVRQRLETPYSSPVVKVMHYVENHLDSKICLDLAADFAGVHPAYLSSLFKKETGLSFTEYIAVRKIQESSYFVRHTEYSVSQIASLYGFSSQSYYITTFKKVMGTTPEKYRRQLLAE